jgi:hypothetical protein
VASSLSRPPCVLGTFLIGKWIRDDAPRASRADHVGWLSRNGISTTKKNASGRTVPSCEAGFVGKTECRRYRFPHTEVSAVSPRPLLLAWGYVTPERGSGSPCRGQPCQAASDGHPWAGRRWWPRNGTGKSLASALGLSEHGAGAPDGRSFTYDGGASRHRDGAASPATGGMSAPARFRWRTGLPVAVLVGSWASCWAAGSGGTLPPALPR